MRRNFRQWIAEQWRTDPAYAYLHAAAEPLVNQFSTAGLQISLSEPNWKPNSRLTPGTYIAKDPTVRVHAGSERCYVIVQIEQSNANAWQEAGIQYGYLEYGQFISGVIRPGSMSVPSAGNAWYRIVDASEADQAFPVFTTVHVPPETTAEELSEAAANVLTIRAWAVQAQGVDGLQGALSLLSKSVRNA